MSMTKLYKINNISKIVIIFELNKEIMELSKTKAGSLSQLSKKKYRDSQNLFIAEGEKNVMELLGSFDLYHVIASKEWIESHEETCHKIGDKLLEGKKELIKKISSLSTPPEVLAIFNKPKYEKIVSLPDDKLYLILDGVQDPGNLGTIIRTADWFGIDTVFASFQTADIYNAKALQATMGSLKRVKVIYCNLEELIKDNDRLPVIGTLLEGKNLYQENIPGYGFVIMGNEGKGISESLRQLIEYKIKIPPYHPTNHAESLNVAIATGIILSYIRQK